MITSKHIFCFIAFALILSSNQTFAQKTTINGSVVDKNNQPLPSVNILFLGTTIGTISDINGRYVLETNKPGDSLTATFIGFQAQTLSVEKGITQKLDFILNEDVSELDDVVVTANRKDKNPALTFMKKVVDHKSQNDLFQNDFLEYESYSKIEIDLNNLEEEFQDRKVMQRFGFMFDQESTDDSTSKPFTNHIIPVAKGDTIYIFTDGFADQFGGERGKKFKYKPFKELLLSLHDLPLDEQHDALDAHFEAWRGQLEQVDDVCVIGTRISAES
jgi:hypothetical protein